MNHLLNVWLSIFLFFFAVDVSAQTQPVKGKVIGEEGEPVVGATVKVTDTSVGAITNIDGEFQLNAPIEAESITVSFIGFATKVVPINENMLIELAQQNTTLDDVVVIGYGTQKKSDLTGAVSVVKVDELAEQPSGDVTNQLQGRVSGITITGSGQPGAAPKIQIRGANTFGDNTPLFVVDGIPTSNINNLNPNDVESMQVLKDAGAASIYGARAANGVVIITTKKGKQGIQLKYNGFVGNQLVQNGNPWDILNTQEMAELTFMALRNTNPNTAINHPQYGSGPTPTIPNYIAPAGAQTVDEAKYYVNPDYNDPEELNQFYRINKANKQGTNWFQELFNPAIITSHNLSLSSASDKGSVFVSGNFFQQDGMLENTYLKRYTIRANSNFSISDKLRIGENLSYTIRQNPQINDLSEGSAIGHSFRQQPIIPVYDIKGNFAGSFGPGLGNAFNPVAMQERLKNNRGVGNQLFGNIFVEYDLFDNLKLRSTFGGQYFSNSFNSFSFPQYENAENGPTSSYSEATATNFNWTWTNTATYSKVMNKVHDLKLMAGVEAYQNKGREAGGTTTGYFSFDPDYTTLSTGSGTPTNYSFKYADALSSIFSRLDYQFDDRYIASFTLRRDGSSRFLNDQYAVFPAASFGWHISNESFFQIDWFDMLKLRGGHGVMGNQVNVNPANAFTTYGANRTTSFYAINGSNGDLDEGFQKTRIGNPEANWEKNINTNIGFDASLFNHKVELTVDYYQKEIDELLFDPNLLATQGAAEKPFVNTARMKNDGIDIDMSTYFEPVEDLKFNTTVSFTSYNNRIEEISNISDYFDLEGRRFNGSFIIRNQVGRPISEYFGYQVDGFWDSQKEIDNANASAPSGTYQQDVAVGRFRYADIDGDGEITPNDRTSLGDPNPDFTYGLNLDFQYKAFDLSMFLYGSQGNDIWNNVRWWTDFYSSFTGAKSKTALYDSWTPDNTNASAPIQETNGSFSSADVPNSYFVEDGSYLRARQMQLGYTLPNTTLDKMKLNNLRLYVQMVNPFTITSYSGIDPEISGSTTAFGIDEGTYPNQRQILGGLNLTF